jgi:hypothetical protein
MGLEVRTQRGLHIKIEQAAKRIVGAVEVHPAAVGCDVIGAGLLNRSTMWSRFHNRGPDSGAA